MKKIIVSFLSATLLLLAVSCAAQPKSDAVPAAIADKAWEYTQYIGENLLNRDAGDPDNLRHETLLWAEGILREAGYGDDAIDFQSYDVGVDDEIGSCENLIVKKTGKDDSKCVIVNAHYDGDGVGDNGSGVALTLAAAVGAAKAKLPYTVYFALCDREEVDSLGAEKYFGGLSEEKLASVICGVNIDSVLFGDYCNVYGGIADPETGAVTQTEAYDHAMEIAASLGYHVYGPAELDGYFASHGTGPELDSRGVFTSPWSKQNDNPSETLHPTLITYSPATVPYSDHVFYIDNNIPYIYFEATNWFAKGLHSKVEYSGYMETYNEEIGDGGMIMNTEFDTLETLNTYFPGRAQEHFALYSDLLYHLLLDPELD